jgi:hypothetical protein
MLGNKKGDILDVLRNQEHQREIVHSQGDIKQRVRIDQKDYVFDSFLNRSRYTLYSEIHRKVSASIDGRSHYLGAAEGRAAQPRDLKDASRHMQSRSS